MEQTALRGAIYGISAAAIWGGMYVVSDIVLRTIPPFSLLALRLLLGLVVLGALLRFKLPALKRSELVWLLGVGVIGFGISLGAQFVGTSQSSAVNGALITSASPAFILIFAAGILRERLTTLRLIATALATIGVIVILNPAEADFSSVTFFGDLMLAIAALTWGLYSVLVRWVSRAMDTLIVTFYLFIGGLILVIPAAMIELQTQAIGAIDGGTVIGVLYLGVISTAAAMWLWNRAFALVDASVASLFFFAQPLVGVILSALILGQGMTAPLWIGGGLIAIGVLIALRPPKSNLVEQNHH